MNRGISKLAGNRRLGVNLFGNRVFQQRAVQYNAGNRFSPAEDTPMDEPHDVDTLWNPDDAGSTTIAPERQTSRARKRNRQPRYHVLLWDSDDHTYDYVEKMLRELFGHTEEACHKIAETVDTDGRATVLTTTKEHAELKRDQIHAYGKDHTEASKGSMWSTIEAEE
jgi:ATP-dependent Clp protease adaptor protein ClpS